jgi:alkylation response protein AidB-like acyl-CoA dehydrogenase
MIVDLLAKGVTIQPLRSITGDCEFSEVFFDHVFVPDSDVVGEVNSGWTIARATLGNERASLGSRTPSSREVDLAELLRLAATNSEHAAGAVVQIGALVAEAQAIQLINLRTAMRAVIGDAPSVDGNVTKLLSSELGQRLADMAFQLAGADAAVIDVEGSPARQWLDARCLSIAGGTSEIARNQIGERVLGLPREPGLR